MFITHLHALARRELSSLARARYMPRGYNRTASQQAERKHYELGKYLDEVLPTTADPLMQNPSHSTLESLLAQAAQERTLRAMVHKMVELLAALPRMDQGDANALADIHERLASAERLSSQVDVSCKAFDDMAGHAQRLDIDYSAVTEALKDLQREIAQKVEALQDNERRLTEAP